MDDEGTRVAILKPGRLLGTCQVTRGCWEEEESTNPKALRPEPRTLGAAKGSVWLELREEVGGRQRDN